MDTIQTNQFQKEFNKDSSQPRKIYFNNVTNNHILPKNADLNELNNL